MEQKQRHCSQDSLNKLCVTFSLPITYCLSNIIDQLSPQFHQKQNQLRLIEKGITEDSSEN